MKLFTVHNESSQLKVEEYDFDFTEVDFPEGFRDRFLPQEQL